MSSILSEQPVRTQSNKSHRKNSNFNLNSQKKFKFDRNGRKRSKSFSGGGCKIKNMQPVLPTKFLLGGNIHDPLNLNSLQDEEINRAMNAVTPKSSPIPTPPQRKGKIEVIIPPNLNDPLNLIDCADDAEYEQQLCSPLKKGKKKRLRKRRTTSGNMDNSDVDTSAVSEAKTPEASKDSAKIPDETDQSKTKDLTLELSPKIEKNKRKSEEHKENLKKMKYSMDKIVSPVIPQPGAWLKRSNSHHWNHKPIRKQNKIPADKLPQFKEKNKQFQYGNYNRYYGYRNPQNEIDPRLKCFANHINLFDGKDILDIGCNIGHVTLSVARDFGAKSVVGIDIDKKLINIARKNIKHYVSSESPTRDNDLTDSISLLNKKNSEFFPISMPILYGPIDIPGFNDQKKGQGFPNNVTFVQGNYVLEDDNLLNMEQSQFDVILCLSITKWIHLNWGDNGIKRAFRRMFAQLRPGGKLILEPQNWTSYKSKKNLTEITYKNYNSIELFPDNFTQYLLSPEVGFAKSEIIGFPHNLSKGFQRPIHVYTKSTILSSERVECPLSSGSYTRKVYLPSSDLSRRSSFSDNQDSNRESDDRQFMNSGTRHIYLSAINQETNSNSQDNYLTTYNGESNDNCVKCDDNCNCQYNNNLKSINNLTSEQQITFTESHSINDDNRNFTSDNT